MQTLAPTDKDYWKHIVASNNALGIKLLPSFQGPGKAANVVFSPVSIFVTMCLLYNGSCNQTYLDLATALGLPSDKDLNPWMRQLINYINGHDPNELDVQLLSALFFATGEHLHFDFVNAITESYSASLYSLDFTQPDARDRVNGWCSNATRGNIPALVPPLPPDTRFVIANACYFLGKWVYKFPGTPLELDFYLPDGGSKRTSMMTQTESFHYFENNDCQTVLLPFEGGNYALQVVLPRTMQSPMRFLPTIEDLARGALSQPPVPIRLSMPKFEMDFEAQLQNALGLIGVPDLSDPSVCDFGRIGSEFTGSLIIHKAKIKVDDWGCEAAAATAMGMWGGAAGVPQFRAEMTVDHPFIYSICDTVTGQILFLGTMFVP